MLSKVQNKQIKLLAFGEVGIYLHQKRFLFDIHLARYDSSVPGRDTEPGGIIVRTPRSAKDAMILPAN
jgi:hypothetical protein